MKRITFKYGATQNAVNFSGETIQDLYDEVGTLYAIPDDASVILNGGEATFDHELAAGDVVEFRKATGTKG